MSFVGKENQQTCMYKVALALESETSLRIFAREGINTSQRDKNTACDKEGIAKRDQPRPAFTSEAQLCNGSSSLFLRLTSSTNEKPRPSRKSRPSLPTDAFSVQLTASLLVPLLLSS